MLCGPMHRAEAPYRRRMTVPRGAHIRAPRVTLDPAIPGASDRPLFVHNQRPNWLGEGRLRETGDWGEGRLEVVHSKAPRSGRIESDP